MFKTTNCRNLFMMLLGALSVVIHAPAEAGEPGRGEYDVVSPRRAMAALAATCVAASVFEDSTPGLGLYEEGSYLLGTQLKRDERRSMTCHFQAGVAYVLVGFGDAEARDVDIRIHDENGVVIAQDVETDATPVVVWVPEDTGRYTVELNLVLPAYDQDSAFCSLCILQDGGWHVPVRNCLSAVEDLSEVAAYVGRNDQGLVRMARGNCWAVEAAVMKEGESNSTRSVQLEEGIHYFIGAADGFAIDVDNLVQTMDGDDIARDQLTDKYPVAKFVGGSTSFGTTTTLHRASGPSLVLQALLTADR